MDLLDINAPRLLMESVNVLSEELPDGAFSIADEAEEQEEYDEHV